MNTKKKRKNTGALHCQPDRSSGVCLELGKTALFGIAHFNGSLSVSAMKCSWHFWTIQCIGRVVKAVRIKFPQAPSVQNWRALISVKWRQ